MHHVIARELLQSTCICVSFTYGWEDNADAKYDWFNAVDPANEQCIVRRLQLEFCRSSLKARLLSLPPIFFPLHSALFSPFLSFLSAAMIPLRRWPLHCAFILLHLNIHPNHYTFSEATQPRIWKAKLQIDFASIWFSALSVALLILAFSSHLLAFVRHCFHFFKR